MSPAALVRALAEHARRVERRELRDLRDWLERTQNLVHLSVLVFVPLLIAVVTFLANAVDLLPFLLFPPLASGTYTLFANPESRYASPRRFVGGLTAGAVCGWVALEVAARFWYQVQPATLAVDPGAAAFSVLLTGVVTWTLDIEESSAFSTALLILVTGTTQFTYLVSVIASSSIVAGVFVLWRRHFYERRASYLYRSTEGDDNVLVPMRGGHPAATAMLGARLAAAHEAGKVVLLDLVDDETVAREERRLLGDEAATDGGDLLDADDADPETGGVAAETVAVLEERADRIRSAVDVPCEVLVAAAGADPAVTTRRVAEENGCDLIAAPYEFDAEYGRLSAYLRGLLSGEVDVVIHQSDRGRTEWHDALVSVARAGDVAHAMIEFATRLADEEVSVCHCIGSERTRRRAEEMLADLVETVRGHVETRVARDSVESYLGRVAGDYDVVFMGASTDRSRASRLISRPTFERVHELGTDVVLVHRP